MPESLDNGVVSLIASPPRGWEVFGPCDRGVPWAGVWQRPGRRWSHVASCRPRWRPRCCSASPPRPPPPRAADPRPARDRQEGGGEGAHGAAAPGAVGKRHPARHAGQRRGHLPHRLEREHVRGPRHHRLLPGAAQRAGLRRGPATGPAGRGPVLGRRGRAGGRGRQRPGRDLSHRYPQPVPKPGDDGSEADNTLWLWSSDDGGKASRPRGWWAPGRSAAARPPMGPPTTRRSAA